jgi:alkylation response protein AidB-like acyl-CoA dehydrogenase
MESGGLFMGLRSGIPFFLAKFGRGKPGADDGRITNGIWSDYACMAVRTGGPGAAGISLLLVPLKDTPGVTMRRQSVSGLASSGTTYIELDDVRVPVDNLIGEENQGMRYIVTNFNHERLAVAMGATRQARVAMSAAFEYVFKREALASRWSSSLWCGTGWPRRARCWRV